MNWGRKNPAMVLKHFPDSPLSLILHLFLWANIQWESVLWSSHLYLRSISLSSSSAYLMNPCYRNEKFATGRVEHNIFSPDLIDEWSLYQEIQLRKLTTIKFTILNLFGFISIMRYHSSMNRLISLPSWCRFADQNTFLWFRTCLKLPKRALTKEWDFCWMK